MKTPHANASAWSANSASILAIVVVVVVVLAMSAALKSAAGTRAGFSVTALVPALVTAFPAGFATVSAADTWTKPAHPADLGPQHGRVRQTTRMDRRNQPIRLNRSEPQSRSQHYAGLPRGVLHRTTTGPCVSRDGYSSSPATSAPSPATASAMAFTPSDSRIRFSISRAMSGFSRRNSRALSLP